MKILATLTGLAPWMLLRTDPHNNATFVIATLITNYKLGNEHREDHYLVDGDFSDAPTPRNVTPYSNPIHHPVEIDDEDGAGHLFWRPYNSSPTTAWTPREYDVQDLLIPIPITSMAALPDGRIIGDSLDYNGFWRYTPASNTT
jgi:hypothetical protein